MQRSINEKDDELPKTMIVNKSTSSGFDTWEPKDQKKVDRIVGNKKLYSQNIWEKMAD